LLIVGLLLVVVVGVLEDFLRRRVPLVPKWPYLLLGVLGLFLVMQFMLLALRREPSAGESSSGKSAHPHEGGESPD
jgi:hypothetical protein